jgi:pSer/pThr/pTyr-binding forkhead associated (FHA) protein
MPAVALTFMSGPRDGELCAIDVAGDGDEVTIGRLAPCTVLVEGDPEVSRRHARLALKHGEWWLEDLASANGTFLGEFAKSVRLNAPVKLVSGQIFRVGLTRIRFGLAGDAASLGVGAAQGMAT